MNPAPSLWQQLRALWRRKSLRTGIDEELQFHLEQRIAENIAAGMTPEAAARAARKRFGNWQSVREECREKHGASFGEATLRDLRFAFRQLLKHPGFTVGAGLTLALGIGATTAIFSVVNGVLLAPLPFRTPEQLVELHESVPRRGSDRIPVAAPTFLDWRSQATSFAGMSAMAHTGYNLTGQGEARRLSGARVSANFFHLLGVHAVAGRTFAGDEDTVGNHPVAILGQTLWQRAFGGDPAIIGRTIQLDGKSHLVIGVVPDGIALPLPRTEIWTPLVFTADELVNRESRSLRVLGRLKAGVSQAQAEVEMAAISTRIAKQDEGLAGFTCRLAGLHEETVSATRKPLLILLGAVFCLLLIACANVANLLLARAAARSREFAVRASLGAGRGQILRQLLAEGGLLGFISGALGVVLGYAALALILGLTPAGIPRLAGVTLDMRVLAFTLLLALGTGILSSLAPAMSASRGDLNDVLKDCGRGTTEGFRGNRFRSSLVVCQIALALVLLAGAGLLLRSFARLNDVDPGFKPSNLLTASLSLPERRYPNRGVQAAMFQRIVDDLSRLPGVISAAAVCGLPYDGMISKATLSIEGRPKPTADEPNGASYRQATPGYFHALGAIILRGRDFTPADTLGSTPVLVVNEAFSRTFFPNAPLDRVVGQWVDLGDNAKELWKIVGVVRDIRDVNLAEPAEPQMFCPVSQSCWGCMSLVVRTVGDPDLMVGALRQTIAKQDPDLPLENVGAMTALLDRTLSERRLRAGLLAAFAVLALLLSAAGIYGVMACSVSRRTHEIGIRMALGAQLGDVLRLVLRHGVVLTGCGVAIGLLGGLLLARLLGSLLFQIQPNDPTTFGCVSLLLVLVALIACWLPARRATRVNPIEALRCE